MNTEPRMGFNSLCCVMWLGCSSCGHQGVPAGDQGRARGLRPLQRARVQRRRVLHGRLPARQIQICRSAQIPFSFTHAAHSHRVAPPLDSRTFSLIWPPIHTSTHPHTHPPRALYQGRAQASGAVIVQANTGAATTAVPGEHRGAWAGSHGNSLVVSGGPVR